MSTKICIEYNGDEFTLEYSRNSVKQMEQQGFSLDKITDQPMTMIPMLVYGAFTKNHKGIKRSLVDEIYDHTVDKIADGDNGFIHALLEMYAETMNVLTQDNPVDEGNRAVWKVMKG